MSLNFTKETVIIITLLLAVPGITQIFPKVMHLRKGDYHPGLIFKNLWNWIDFMRFLMGFYLLEILSGPTPEDETVARLKLGLPLICFLPQMLGFKHQLIILAPLSYIVAYAFIFSDPLLVSIAVCATTAVSYTQKNTYIFLLVFAVIMAVGCYLIGSLSLYTVLLITFCVIPYLAAAFLLKPLYYILASGSS